jgi:hypothetical protein
MKAFIIMASFFLASSTFGTFAHADLPAPFAVIGDTQRTLAIEEVFLRREQNDQERPELMAAILADGPKFLVHLGDMIDWGASTEEWKYFDQLTEPLRAAAIPIYPAVGNHEYLGFNRGQEMTDLNERFPELARSHWYLKYDGDLALVFLDSNQRKLGQVDWRRQVDWFSSTLVKLDSDPKVRGVIVFAHHPAFSNSKVSGDEDCVRRYFLPQLLHSKKTLAYIDGHAHGYEHFFEGGKHFIVSGGGGGPRVSYFTGVKARHHDLYKGPIPRPFNYLLVRAVENEVIIKVRGFESGETVHTLDEIEIAYPKKSIQSIEAAK